MGAVDFNVQAAITVDLQKRIDVRIDKFVQTRVDLVNVAAEAEAAADAVGVAALAQTLTAAQAVSSQGLAEAFSESTASASRAVLPVASIGDRVWHDLNGNGQQDDGEPGIAGAEVRLLAADGTILTTLTNTFGGYSFSGLTPGEYVVQFVVPDGFAQATLFQAGADPTIDSDANPDNMLQSDPVTLTAGEFDRTIDAGFLGSASIGNEVFNDLDGDGERDPADPGIPNVTLALIEDADNDGVIDPFETVIDTQTTDQNGEYVFAGLAAGDYLVSVTDANGVLAGLVLTTPPEPRAVRVAVGEARDDVDFGYVGGAAAILLSKNGQFSDESGDGLAQVGETIAYTFTVTNTGDVTLTGVTVTDPMVTVSGGPIDLDPGETDSTTFTGTYVITQADIDAGVKDNTALATGTDPNNAPVTDDDDHSEPLPQGPAIELIKEGEYVDLGDPGLNPGDELRYTFALTNIGNVTLTNVTVEDVAFDLGTLTISGGPIASLAPGDLDDATFTATHVLDQGDIDQILADQQNGDPFVENTARTRGEAPGGNPGDPDDDVTDEDTAQIELPAAAASIVLAKDGTLDLGDDGIANPGDVINYTFAVQNTGDTTLTDVTVTDPLVDVSGGPISLAPGQVDTTTFTGSYAITQADIDAGVRDNLATVTGFDPADTRVTATDPHSEPIPQGPAVMLVKDGTFQDGDGDGLADVGETISYTFTVINTGNVTLSDVTVTDPMLDVAGGPIGLAPGEVDATTFTGSYVITQADVDAGQKVNLATASGTDPTGAPVSDDATETVLLPVTGSIGNFVWNDLDRDGIQDPGEPGIAGTTINLFDVEEGAVVGSTMTDANGRYAFNDLTAGFYIVFIAPDPDGGGLTYNRFTQVSPPQVGDDPTVDSDGFQLGDGLIVSPTIALGEGESNSTIDFGFSDQVVPQLNIAFVLDASGSTDRQWINADTGFNGAEIPGIIIDGDEPQQNPFPTDPSDSDSRQNDPGDIIDAEIAAYKNLAQSIVAEVAAAEAQFGLGIPINIELIKFYDNNQISRRLFSLDDTSSLTPLYNALQNTGSSETTNFGPSMVAANNFFQTQLDAEPGGKNILYFLSDGVADNISNSPALGEVLPTEPLSDAIREAWLIVDVDGLSTAENPIGDPMWQIDNTPPPSSLAGVETLEQVTDLTFNPEYLFS